MVSGGVGSSVGNWAILPQGGGGVVRNILPGGPGGGGKGCCHESGFVLVLGFAGSIVQGTEVVVHCFPQLNELFDGETDNFLDGINTMTGMMHDDDARW